MEELVSMLVGDSLTLDVFVVVRLVVFCLSLEFVTIICSILAGMKGR